MGGGQALINFMENKVKLTNKGYTIRKNRYMQKDLKNGWYVDVDIKTNKVQALHSSAYLRERGNHKCYDWEKTNHLNVMGIQKLDLKNTKNYVRNQEAHKVPSHMLVGWADLLESRLS